MEVRVLADNMGLVVGIMFFVVSIICVSRLPKEDGDIREPIRHHYKIRVRRD